MAAARKRLGAEDGAYGDPRRVLREACRLLGGEPVNPIEEPLLDELGQILVEHNVAYPVNPGVYTVEGLYTRYTAYKPAYPAVRRAICEAAERGLTGTLVLVDEILEDIADRRG